MGQGWWCYSMEGRSDGLLSGGDIHSLWPHILDRTVVNTGHGGRCSEECSLNTTDVNLQKCDISVWWPRLLGQRNE